LILLYTPLAVACYHSLTSLSEGARFPLYLVLHFNQDSRSTGIGSPEELDRGLLRDESVWHVDLLIANRQAMTPPHPACMVSVSGFFWHS
jgi:hypothetical protein